MTCDDTLPSVADGAAVTWRNTGGVVPVAPRFTTATSSFTTAEAGERAAAAIDDVLSSADTTAEAVGRPALPAAADD